MIFDLLVGLGRDGLINHRSLHILRHLSRRRRRRRRRAHSSAIPSPRRRRRLPRCCTRTQFTCDCRRPRPHGHYCCILRHIHIYSAAFQNARQSFAELAIQQHKHRRPKPALSLTRQRERWTCRERERARERGTRTQTKREREREREREGARGRFCPIILCVSFCV